LEQTFKGHWALEEKEIVFIGETWEGTFERRFKISSVFPPELAETDTLEVLPKDLGLLEIGEKPIAVTITTTYKLETAEPNPESCVTRSRHTTLVEQARGEPETKPQSSKD